MELSLLELNHFSNALNTSLAVDNFLLATLTSSLVFLP